jgi:hypothetical protein
MLLITDRDLLFIEPSLFLDATQAGTRLLGVSDAVIAGTTLTSASAGFEAAGIDDSHVVQVLSNELALEVDGRVDAGTLHVSLPRASQDDAKIPPGDGTGLAISIVTFGRLIAQAQAWALSSLGFGAAQPTRPLNESAIVNPEPVRRMMAMRTITQAFEQASALDPDNVSLLARAVLYMRRTIEATHQVAALIDLNGDGLPDAMRRMDTINLMRR